MDRVYTLPSSQEESRWIQTNDAQINLSEIKVMEHFCIVPHHIYEDSLIEDEEINLDVLEKDQTVSYPRKHFERIQFLREQSHRACIWYPEVEVKIPTASSLLLEFHSTEELQNALAENISKYPFVRLCTMSPKDVNRIPIYDNWKKAFHDLIKSERTGNIFEEDQCKHLFLRKKKEYQWEVRCFWSRDRLRAISLPSYRDFCSEEKEEILEFFQKYGKDFPYHSAVVDIGRTDQIELIKFNTFGPDMKATSGNFSWYEDVLTLLFSPQPVFR